MDEEVLGHLVHFKKNGEPGPPYPLYAGETTIGADPNADVRLKKKDLCLELIHGMIDVNINGKASLINKSDANPVKINGVVIRREQVLKDYDIFEIGSIKFQYSQIVPKSAKKLVRNTPSHKRYTMFTSSASKVTPKQATVLAKTPRGKRTPIINSVTRSANKSSARKAIINTNAPKSYSCFETQPFNASSVKPDTRNPSMEKPKTTSKVVTRRALGSPALRRRLSLTLDKVHVSKSPKATVSSRNIILGEGNHVITPKLDKSLKTPKSLVKVSKRSSRFTRTPITPRNEDVAAIVAKTPKSQKLARNTPISNKKLITPLKGSPFSKTPKSHKVSKNTPKSNKKLMTPAKGTPAVKTPRSTRKLSDLPLQSMNRMRVALKQMSEENLISFDSPTVNRLSVGNKTRTPASRLSKTPKKGNLDKTPKSVTKITKRTPKSSRKSLSQNVSRALEHMVDQGSNKGSSPVESTSLDTPSGSPANEKLNTSSSSLSNLSDEKVVSVEQPNRSMRSQPINDSLRRVSAARVTPQSPHIQNTEDVNTSVRSKRSSVRMSGVKKLLNESNDSSNSYHTWSGDEEQSADLSTMNKSSRSNRLLTNESKEPRRSSLRLSCNEDQHDYSSDEFAKDITRRSKRSSLHTSHIEHHDVQPAELSMTRRSNTSTLHSEDVAPQQLSVTNKSRRSNRSSLHKSAVGSQEDTEVANTSRHSSRSSLHKSRAEEDEAIHPDELSVTNTSRYSGRSSLHKSLAEDHEDVDPDELSVTNTSRYSGRLSLQQSRAEDNEDVDPDELSVTNTSRYSGRLCLQKSRAVDYEGVYPDELSVTNTSKCSGRSSLHKSRVEGHEVANSAGLSVMNTSRYSEDHEDNSAVGPQNDTEAAEVSVANTSRYSSRSSLHKSRAEDDEAIHPDELSVTNTSRYSGRSSLHKSRAEDHEDVHPDESSVRNTSRYSGRLSLQKSRAEDHEDVHLDEISVANASRCSGRSSLRKSRIEDNKDELSVTNTSRYSGRLSLQKSRAEDHEDVHIGEISVANTSRYSGRSSLRKSRIEDNEDELSVTNTSRYSDRLSLQKSRAKDHEDVDPDELSVTNTSRYSGRSSLHKSCAEDHKDVHPDELSVANTSKYSGRPSIHKSCAENHEDLHSDGLSVTNTSKYSSRSSHRSRTEDHEDVDLDELSVTNASRYSGRSSLHKSRAEDQDAHSEKLSTTNTSRRSRTSSLHKSHVEASDDSTSEEISMTNTSGHSSKANRSSSHIGNQGGSDSGSLNMSKHGRRPSLRRSHLDKTQSKLDSEPVTSRRSYRASVNVEQKEGTTGQEQLSLERSPDASNTLKHPNRSSSRHSRVASLEDISTELLIANESRYSTRSSLHDSDVSPPEEDISMEELSVANTSSCSTSSGELEGDHSMHHVTSRSSRSSLHKSRVEKSANVSKVSNRSSLYKSQVKHENNLDTSAASRSKQCSTSSGKKVHAEYSRDDLDRRESNTSIESSVSSWGESDLESPEMHADAVEVSEINISIRSEKSRRRSNVADRVGDSSREESVVVNASRRSVRSSFTDNSPVANIEGDVKNASRRSSRSYLNTTNHDVPNVKESSVNEMDPLTLPSEAVQTPHILSSSQYSMISEASTRSSGRHKRLPSKFKDSFCSISLNSSTRKTPKSEMTADAAQNLLTPSIQDRELTFDGTASSTPHQGRTRSLIKTPNSAIRHNRSVSFVESTPIPKQPHCMYRNSSVQIILDDSDISKVLHKSVDGKSPAKYAKSYSVISILDDPTIEGNQTLEINADRSGKNTRSRLGGPTSPLDSLIVNVDSDTELPSGSLQNSSFITPKERQASLRRSKTPSVSSTTSNGSLANDSANFATPENNISVIELSDDCLTPNSHVKRPKSKSMVRVSDQEDTCTTPKNTNQFGDDGFKTPLNTPALFESLKKSVVRSRKRFNNSAASLCENDDGTCSLDERSAMASSLSEEKVSGADASLRRLSRSARKNLTQLSEEAIDVVPVTGVKRGRDSSGSILRTAKKKKGVHRDENQPRESLAFDTSSDSEVMSERSLNTSTESLASSASSVQSPGSGQSRSNHNRSRLSLTERKAKRTTNRRSLQGVNICTYVDPHTVELDHSLSSASVSSVSTSEGSRRSQNQISAFEDAHQAGIYRKSIPKSPAKDVTDVERPARTPRRVKSPRNDLTDIRGVKKLLQTPREQTSPKNDLTDVRGVKSLLKTPRQQRSPRNDLTKIPGVARLMRTPKVPKSPRNDLTNIKGIKHVFASPRTQRSPKNDLTNVAGVKKLLGTPKVPKSPRNDLTNIPNLRKLVGTPRLRNEPLNDLSDVRGIKQLYKSPRQRKEPRNDLSNVAGVKKLLSSPKERRSPKNDLSDVRGVKRMYLTEEAAANRRSMDTSGIDVLFQTSENQSDIENLDVFSNMHRKPLRTYRGKSSSPKKVFEDDTRVRRTLGDIPLNSPLVEKWVEEQTKYTQEKDKHGAKTSKLSKTVQSDTLPKELRVEVSKMSTEEGEVVPKEEPVSKTKRTRAKKAVDSPVVTSRRRKLVVEIDPIEIQGSRRNENEIDADSQADKKEPTNKRRRAKQPSKLQIEEADDVSISDAKITEPNDRKQEETRPRRRQKLADKSSKEDSSAVNESDNVSDKPKLRQVGRRAGKIPVEAPGEDTDVKETEKARRPLRTRRGRKVADEAVQNNSDAEASDNTVEPKHMQTPKPVGKTTVKSSEEDSDVKVTENAEKQLRNRRGRKVADKAIENDSDAEESNDTNIETPKPIGKTIKKSSEDSGGKDSDDKVDEVKARKTRKVASKTVPRSIEDDVRDQPRSRRGRKPAVEPPENINVTRESDNSAEEPRRGRRRNIVNTVAAKTPAEETANEETSDSNSEPIRKTKRTGKKAELLKNAPENEEAEAPTSARGNEKSQRPVRQRRGRKLSVEQETPISTPVKATRKATKKELADFTEPEVTPRRGRRKAAETTLEEPSSEKSVRTTRKNKVVSAESETPKSPAKKVTRGRRNVKPVAMSSDTETEDKVVEMKPAKRTRRKVLENVDEMLKVEEKTDAKQKVTGEAQIIRMSTRRRK